MPPSAGITYKVERVRKILDLIHLHHGAKLYLPSMVNMKNADLEALLRCLSDAEGGTLGQTTPDRRVEPRSRTQPQPGSARP